MSEERESYEAGGEGELELRDFALSLVQSDNPMCIEMNCQAAYFEERLKAEMQTKYAAVLDKCGHHWFPGYEGSTCVRCKLEARITELEKQLGEAREALRPFAMFYIQFAHEADDFQIYAFSPWLIPNSMTVGDARRAYAILAAATAPQPPSEVQKEEEEEEGEYPARDGVRDTSVREGEQDEE